MKCVCQTNCSGGLALSCRCRGNSGNQNELTVRFVLLFLEQIVVDFSLVLAVLLYILVINTCFFSDFADVSHH